MLTFPCIATSHLFVPCGLVCQLGIGSRSNAPIPQHLSCMRQHTVVQASAGDEHTLILTEMGHVFACGRADMGQLGVVVESNSVAKTRPGTQPLMTCGIVMMVPLG